MSPDPAVPSPPLSPPAARTARRRAREDLAAPAVAEPCPERSPRGLDRMSWCAWWRDLILERHRVPRFDDLVPLSDGRCPWAMRVDLGVAVADALGAIYGPSATAELVAEALAAAGFGPVRGGTGSAARVEGGDGAHRAISRSGDDDLRLGLLGTIADALLGGIPPDGRASIDLRDAPARDASGTADLDETVVAATRDAVFAYAAHVEDQAARSLGTARLLRAVHAIA